MPKSDSATPRDADDKDLYSGLIRLHILYHAAEEPIFGLRMVEELGRHGYKLSTGTLYPILHGLEKKGYLRSREHRLGRTTRRVYRATALGRKALLKAKERVSELFGELFEAEPLPNGRRGKVARGRSVAV
jgi:DNA-binding PadR family transcriptional regulator